MADARVTQERADVVLNPDDGVRVTQQRADVVMNPDDGVRVTQFRVDVITFSPPVEGGIGWGIVMG